MNFHYLLFFFVFILFCNCDNRILANIDEEYGSDSDESEELKNVEVNNEENEKSTENNKLNESAQKSENTPKSKNDKEASKDQKEEILKKDQKEEAPKSDEKKESSETNENKESSKTNENIENNVEKAALVTDDNKKELESSDFEKNKDSNKLLSTEVPTEILRTDLKGLAILYQKKLNILINNAATLNIYLENDNELIIRKRLLFDRETNICSIKFTTDQEMLVKMYDGFEIILDQNSILDQLFGISWYWWIVILVVIIIAISIIVSVISCAAVGYCCCRPRKSDTDIYIKRNENTEEYI